MDPAIEAITALDMELAGITGVTAAREVDTGTATALGGVMTIAKAEAAGGVVTIAAADMVQVGGANRMTKAPDGDVGVAGKAWEDRSE